MVMKLSHRDYYKYTQGNIDVLILTKENRDITRSYALIFVETRDDLVNLRDTINAALKQEDTLDRKFVKADPMKARFEDIEFIKCE
jgi:hypothetical protein